jgi:hypothetical protein
MIPAFRGYPTLGACLVAAAWIQARFPAVRVIAAADWRSDGGVRNPGFAHARGGSRLCFDQGAIGPVDPAARRADHPSFAHPPHPNDDADSGPS